MVCFGGGQGSQEYLRPWWVQAGECPEPPERQAEPPAPAPTAQNWDFHHFSLITQSCSVPLTSCPYLLQVICFTINLHYFFISFFFSFSLSHLKKERDYLISTASEINPHYGFVREEEETDFHSQPVLDRYLKVIAQPRDISLV